MGDRAGSRQAIVMSRLDWSTRTALVTGASSGIGRALSRMLAARGCKVILVASNPTALARVQNEICGETMALALDLTDGRAVDRVLERVQPGFEAIDVLVNCAGQDLGGGCRFDKADITAVESVVALNLLGLMRLTRMILPGMLDRGRGDIVNLGSVVSQQRSRHLAAYASTKHGVHGFSESLREDYADTDLRIIEILPGPVRTNFARRRWRGDETKANEFYDTFPATLTPEDVAACIVWALEQPPQVTISEITINPTRER